MTKRVHVLVSGRVQNVGYRAFVVRAAEQLRLAGWVRNLEGGRRVELEAEGDAQAVEALIALLHQGPTAARVERVLVEQRLPLGQASGRFQVR
jgi:acylphosphatase